jgi:hypothetical protein
MSNPEIIPVDIIFDSNYADNGDLDAPSFYMDPPLGNVVGIGVLWANIPYSYFTIDRFNNQFFFQNNANGGGAIAVCSIRPGTYNPDSFCRELERCFAQSAVEDGVNMRCYMDPATARLTIYNRFLPVSKQFIIWCENQLLCDILGLPNNANGTPNPWGPSLGISPRFKTHFVNGEQILPGGGAGNNNDSLKRIWVWQPIGLLNLSYASNINIHSSLSTDMGIANRIDSKAPSDMLLKIPVTSNFTSFINYNTYQMITPVRRLNLDRVDFYLTLPGRSVYAKNSKDLVGSEESQAPSTQPQAGSPVDPLLPDYIQTRYLPLNGQGFQIAIRFLVDTGNVK